MLDTIFLIILLLLVTLMNSSVIRGFPVNLPAFSEEPPIQKPVDKIEISIDHQGTIYLDKKPLPLLQLNSTLLAINAHVTNKTILLRADDATPYGQVAELLYRISNCLPDKKVILVTQPPVKTSVKTEDQKLP